LFPGFLCHKIGLPEYGINNTRFVEPCSWQ